MLYNFLLVIGLLLFGYFFGRYFLLSVLWVISMFLIAGWMILRAAFLPFTYLPKHKWLWAVQIPLLVFYLLFLYHGSWSALPWVVLINALVFLIVHCAYGIAGRVPFP